MLAIFKSLSLSREREKRPELSRDLAQKIDIKLLALGRVIKNFSESPHNHMDWAFVAHVQNINRHIDYVIEELNHAFEYTNNVPKRYFDAFKGLQVSLKSVLEEEEILKIEDESLDLFRNSFHQLQITDPCN